MAPIVPYVLVGMGLFSAASSVMSGLSQSQAMRAQAAGARYNQDVALMNAAQVRQAWDFKERQMRERKLRLLGAQQVGYGAAGVEPGEGTPLEVMASTAAEIERDIAAERFNYQTQARRYETQAGFYDFEAERNESMAGFGVLQGIAGAGTTLLGTAAKLWGPGGTGTTRNADGSLLGGYPTRISY